jgi:hypothetical protein
MATRKQATKPAPKPARKPASKPAPLDLVRNPNFDSAMAQKNYANFMADQLARLAAQRGQRSAEDISNQYNKLVGDLGKPTDPKAGFRQAGLAAKQGQYTQGRLMGAPTNQPAQSRVPMGFSTYEEAGIPPEQAKILDDEMAKMQSEIAAQQGRQNAEDIYNQFNEVASGINELMPAQPQQAPQPIQTIAGPRSAVQMNPQKMQAFQNFLQQGIQRSNTMNQDAAAGFANAAAGLANPQPGMQPTQPAMPVAGMGMGMQQSRKAPAPRKFSIASNPSAKAV